MSPVPVDQDAPEAKTKTSRDVGAREVALQDDVLRPDMPLVRCRVVYMGSSKSMSVPLVGSVDEEFTEDPDGPVERPNRQGVVRRYRVFRKASDAGITGYDFSSHDSMGEIIRSRQVPNSPAFPERMRGRPFVWCEHVGHVRAFFQRQKDGSREFEILVPPEHLGVVQAYIRKSERGVRQQEQLFREIAGG